MTDMKGKRPRPGDTVILIEVPPGLLEGLPIVDQRAISEMVGKPVILNEYDEHGRAELEFKDSEGVIHFIYVDPHFIKVA